MNITKENWRDYCRVRYEDCMTVPTSNPYVEMVGIGPNAFEGLDFLRIISLSREVSLIGREAFAGCVSLRNVTMSACPAYISARVFAGCKNVTITVNGTKEMWDKVDKAPNWDAGVDNLKVVYECADGEVPPINIQIDRDAPLKDANSRPIECTGEPFECLVLPWGLERVEADAFPPKLQWLIIPSTVTYIGKLSYVPENVIYLGDMEKWLELWDYEVYTDVTVTCDDGVIEYREGDFTSIPKHRSHAVVTDADGDLFERVSDGHLVIPTDTITRRYDWTFEQHHWTVIDTLPECKTLTIPTSITDIDMHALSGVRDIYYNGTLEQWDAIEKDGPLPFSTVHCKDADIILS